MKRLKEPITPTTFARAEGSSPVSPFPPPKSKYWWTTHKYPSLVPRKNSKCHNNLHPHRRFKYSRFLTDTHAGSNNYCWFTQKLPNVANEKQQARKRIRTSISSNVGRLGCSFASTKRPGWFLSSKNICHSLDVEDPSISVTCTNQMSPNFVLPNRILNNHMIKDLWYSCNKDRESKSQLPELRTNSTLSVRAYKVCKDYVSNRGEELALGNRK